MNNYYEVNNLGAFGASLSALSSFFESSWNVPHDKLNDHTKALVLNKAGFFLWALGRLTEAAEPMEVGLEEYIRQKDWKNAAMAAGNLCELYLTIGEVKEAVDYVRKRVDFADQSGDWSHQMRRHINLADALHQAGESGQAEELFEQAEQMQNKNQPDYPYLYSIQGFRFCDLLLSASQYKEVQKRANQTLKWVTQQNWLLDIALDKLSLGRAYLVQVIVEKTGNYTNATDFLNQAVDGLREASHQEFIVRGLLARAELFRYQQSWEKAWADLQEAKEITERGQMNLYMADYHLEAARLCLAEGKKIKEAYEHYKEARERVDKMGYHRRDPELLLIQAELELIDGDKKHAQETLVKAKKLIDKMGCHRWDIEVERLQHKL